jgi:hypothetical protein
MNLTEDKYDDENKEIKKASNSEIVINPKFYGNQSLDNLIDLKLRVHNVLNVIMFRKKLINRQQSKKKKTFLKKNWIKIFLIQRLIRILSNGEKNFVNLL